MSEARSIRIGARPALGLPLGSWGPSRTLRCNEPPSLRLKDRDDVDRLHVPSVLVALGIAEFSFICLIGQFIDPLLCLWVGTQLDEAPGYFGRQAFRDAVQEPVERI